MQLSLGHSSLLLSLWLSTVSERVQQDELRAPGGKPSGFYKAWILLFSSLPVYFKGSVNLCDQNLSSFAFFFFFPVCGKQVQKYFS